MSNVLDGRLLITFKCFVRHEPVGRALCANFFRRFAESERLCLSEHVGQQQIMVSAQRIQRLGKSDEVARDEPRALMNQLDRKSVARWCPALPQ